MPEMQTQKPLEALRARLRALERGAGRSALRALPLGPAALDDRLPGGGLSLSGLHEIAGERAEWDDGAAAGFLAALLAKLAAARPGPILWVASRLDLYGLGLARFGLAPGRLILARAGGDAEALWAVEEGLRSGALAAVVGEVAALERTAGRATLFPAAPPALRATAAGRAERGADPLAGLAAALRGRAGDGGAASSGPAALAGRAAALSRRRAGRFPRGVGRCGG